MTDGRIQILSSSRFLVRTIPLSPTDDIDRRIESAVESLSPFSRRQLYYGALVACDGSCALVYFAYRKHFSKAETVSWRDAKGVYPAFLAWCTEGAESAVILIHSDQGQTTAVAWNGRSPLPDVVLTRASPPHSAEDVLDQVRRRTGLVDAAVRKEEGAVKAQEGSEKGSIAWIIARSGNGNEEVVNEMALGLLKRADVRDPEELLESLSSRRRHQWMWRSIVMAAGLSIVGATIDLGNGILSRILHWREGQIVRQMATVTEIQSEQAMSEHLEALASQRLKLYEILTFLNKPRPDSIEFSRFVTTGPYLVEVNAETSNAEDVHQYESGLRAMPVFVALQVDGLQTREGRTIFTIQAEFKPSVLADLPIQ